jgi:hypothetical protein
MQNQEALTGAIFTKTDNGGSNQQPQQISPVAFNAPTKEQVCWVVPEGVKQYLFHRLHKQTYLDQRRRAEKEKKAFEQETNEWLKTLPDDTTFSFGTFDAVIKSTRSQLAKKNSGKRKRDNSENDHASEEKKVFDHVFAKKNEMEEDDASINNHAAASTNTNNDEIPSESANTLVTSATVDGMRQAAIDACKDGLGIHDFKRFQWSLPNAIKRIINEQREPKDVRYAVLVQDLPKTMSVRKSYSQLPCLPIELLNNVETVKPIDMQPIAEKYAAKAPDVDTLVELQTPVNVIKYLSLSTASLMYSEMAQQYAKPQQELSARFIEALQNGFTVMVNGNALSVKDSFLLSNNKRVSIRSTNVYPPLDLSYTLRLLVNPLLEWCRANKMPEVTNMELTENEIVHIISRIHERALAFAPAPTFNPYMFFRR